MACNHKADSACPFAFTDKSEKIQNHGCLPTPHEIRNMRVEHGKTWACHEEPTKPCAGAIQWLRKEGLPHQVVDTQLLMEHSDWHLYVNPMASAEA